MKALAIVSCACLFACSAMADTLSSVAFDDAAVEAAEQVTIAVRTTLAGDATTPLFPTSVRLPTVDSRKGPQLLGNDLNDTRLYLAQLGERGVSRVAARFAYPMLFEPVQRNNDKYRYYFSRVRRFLDFHEMELVAVLGTQPYDADYWRDMPVGPECTEGFAERVGELATRVNEVLAPDYFVVDLRPSSLARTEGCTTAADPLLAGPLTLAAAAAVQTALPNATVGVMLDAGHDKAYARFVAEAEGSHFLAASSLSVPLEPSAALAELDEIKQLANETGREFAIGELWLRKTERGNGGLDPDLAGRLLADAASVWRDADSWIGHYGHYLDSSGEVLFAMVHETDLLMGAYLDADNYVGPDVGGEFNVATEFSFGSRMRVRSTSKALREQAVRDRQRTERYRPPATGTQ